MTYSVELGKVVLWEGDDLSSAEHIASLYAATIHKTQRTFYSPVTTKPNSKALDWILGTDLISLMVINLALIIGILH